MVKPFLEGKTIAQAMADKRLFIIDLAILEGCPAKSEDIVVSDIDILLFIWASLMSFCRRNARLA